MIIPETVRSVASSKCDTIQGISNDPLTREKNMSGVSGNANDVSSSPVLGKLSPVRPKVDEIFKNSVWLGCQDGVSTSAWNAKIT